MHIKSLGKDCYEAPDGTSEYVTLIFFWILSVWVSRPYRPKGSKDEVKLEVGAGGPQDFRSHIFETTHLTISRNSDHLESDESKSIEENNRGGWKVVAMF